MCNEPVCVRVCVCVCARARVCSCVVYVCEQTRTGACKKSKKSKKSKPAGDAVHMTKLMHHIPKQSREKRVQRTLGNDLGEQVGEGPIKASLPRYNRTLLDEGGEGADHCDHRCIDGCLAGKKEFSVLA
jgi:hypothetical protein